MYIEEYNTRTRAFVKVQDGCENFCSYCIIPHVRGKCRSKDLNTCVEEIKSLVNNGFKEIVLTGIHTGNYGSDIGTNFAALLKELIKIDGLLRIRISSIEATELTPEVLEVIKNSPKIVNHFHVPIQSGSNKVLKLMNRKYNVEEFIKKIEELRSIKEDVSITTDIITGHPGEDDDEFEEVIDTLERIKFSKLHVFPYSIRKEVYKLEEFSQQVRFMHENNIVTKEDLDNFAKNNNEELRILKGTRENLWKRYHRAKTEDKQTQIIAEINDIQPKIKELYKYNKYCKEITKRAEGIQNNLNNFDKDIQKEKDNSRSL